jgi:magnesium-transporting ATPase (P-type)
VAREKSRFNVRRFISLSTFLSFIILAVSGVMMYLRPEGSIARWSGWKLLGLSKKSWEGVHITLALLFALLALVHIVLNWKQLVGYIRRRIAGSLLPGKELAVAALFVVVVFAFSITQWKPASGLMAWRATIKDGHNLMEIHPPVLDADKLQLSEIALLIETDTGEIVRILSGQGFEVRGPEDTLEKIAARAGTTPEEVYRLLLKSLGK